MMENVMPIEPLKDDSSEWRDKSFCRDLLGFFFPDLVLERRLKQQLKARPNVWGIGLWPDAEHEGVAKVCAEGLDAGFGCESVNFIPDDSVNLIGDLDAFHDLCGAEAVLAIELDLGLTIPESALSDCTFGELVRQLVTLRHKRIGEGLPVISDEELADHLEGRCGTTCESSAEDVKIFMVEIAKLFLPWRLFPGLFPWLLVLSLLAAVYVVSSVTFELCGGGEVGHVVTRVIWALMAIAYAFWKGRGDGVQGVLYHLVLMGFSAGFLWYVMARAPVDRIVALLR